jgi:antitoxin ParD1/3/4
MNVTLAPELEQIIRQKMASGLYASANDVIREALRLLEEQDGWLFLRLEELRKEINLGLTHLKNGEGTPGEQVFEEIRQLSQQRRQTITASKSSGS